MSDKPLGKEALLAALDRAEVATREISVPELGGVLRVREMTGSLRNRLEATYATLKGGGDSKGLDKVTVAVVAACVVDENNRPLLAAADASRLMLNRPKVAFRIRDVALELSATDEEDVEAFAEVFGGAQSDVSSSD